MGGGNEEGRYPGRLLGGVGQPLHLPILVVLLYGRLLLQRRLQFGLVVHLGEFHLCHHQLSLLRLQKREESPSVQPICAGPCEHTEKNPQRLPYHHLGQRLQGGLQLVCGGQSVREVHGSRQQQQGGGDLLVQVELQPLPGKKNTTRAIN